MRKRRDQRRAQAASGGEGIFLELAMPIVRYGELPVRAVDLKADHHLAVLPLNGESMLQGVDYELGDDKVNADGMRRQGRTVFGLHRERDRSAVVLSRSMASRSVTSSNASSRVVLEVPAWNT